MVYISCIVTLLLSTVVFADYYIDNADPSVIYSMPAAGRSWQTITMSTPWDISFSNSTGNYTIVLDSSHCYDQNYASAQGGCGTGDNCFIEIPFTGSGITMYVFNAGLSGMTTSSSVDGGAAVSSSIAAPTAAENYQVSNVSLYDVQGLRSGNHTIKMTLMDWEGGGVTFMKFDYAHVNESFVSVPSSTAASSTPITTPTAQLSSQTPIASDRIGTGGIVGITLGVVALLGGIVIGTLIFRRRRASHQPSATSAFESPQIEPFISPSRPHTRHSLSRARAQLDENSPVSPVMRSAILRNAHAIGNLFSSAPIQSPQTARPEAIASVLQPLRQRPSYSADNDPDEGPLAFSGPAIPSQHNLTPAQLETVRGLQADGVHADMITRVIEAFVSEANTRQVIPSSEYALSLDSPPSYQTRAR